MAIIHKVGNPVNKCEDKVIKHLQEHLPNRYHIYHNLELIPQRGGHPYEYDLVIVGDSIAWAVEVKGYRGNIRGNAATWELPNGRYERSPIPLINEKARILKGQIETFSPRFRGSYYVDALVILCNNQTRVELEDPQNDRVVLLSDAITWLNESESKLTRRRPPKDAIHVACEMLDKRFGPLTVQPRIGDYELTDTAISRGSYSVTYPARHTLLKTGGRVSLKVYQLDTSLSTKKLAQWKRLFMREAEALSRMGNHPNVSRCSHPFLWDDDKIVLPLEWIDGPTLRDIFPRIANFPIRRRLKIFRQICTGLEYIHSHGIVHRSLSPENIIVAHGDQVKLINFTLAKIHPSGDELESLFTIAASSYTVATPFLHAVDWRYRSPELVQGVHQATPQTDLFSAGVILFELMTGQCPFSNRQLMLSGTQLERPTALVKELPDTIDEIYLEMCSYDPSRRFVSMADVLKRINAITV